MEILGKYYEDLFVGKTGNTGGKTITLTDVELFREVTDWPICHHNESTVVPEMLVTMIAAGLITRLNFCDGTLVAVAGMGWQYFKQVFVGDSIKVVYEVADNSLSKKNDRGIVTIQLIALNQNKEIVAKGYSKVMMLKKEL